MGVFDMLKYRAVFTGVYAIGATHQAVAAPQLCIIGSLLTTSTDRFVINVSEGTVTDKKSGLMWKACLVWNAI